jgi:hypothetical protein
MKRQLLPGLFLLTTLCAVPIFAQSPSEEKPVTDFVKLKNVPNVPNIVRVYDENDATYHPEQQIIFKKLIDSVKIYLTPKGAVEIDERSRTLIITDKTSNIEFMKGVVAAFDDEEIYLAKGDDRKVVCLGFASNF